jgi:hypothetical protein
MMEREPRNEREAHATLATPVRMPRRQRPLAIRQCRSVFGRLAWAGVIVCAIAAIAADMLMWRPG